jgi:hypothetical protein
METPKLDKLREKLKYWEIQFYYYDSFNDEIVTDYDSDGLVEEVVEELIQATKIKDDIFYKDLINEIEKLKIENKDLKKKLNLIKDIIGK